MSLIRISSVTKGTVRGKKRREHNNPRRSTNKSVQIYDKGQRIATLSIYKFTQVSQVVDFTENQIVTSNFKQD